MSFKHKKTQVKFKKKQVKFKKKQINKQIKNYMNLHVRANFKNTILNLTSKTGKLVKQLSTKSLKKTSFKKNTPYNINFIGNELSKVLKKKGIQRLHLFINGTGYGRRYILRNLKRTITFLSLSNTTPKPFNGCRLKKKKRR